MYIAENVFGVSKQEIGDVLNVTLLNCLGWISSVVIENGSLRIPRNNRWLRRSVFWPAQRCHSNRLQLPQSHGSCWPGDRWVAPGLSALRCTEPRPPRIGIKRLPRLLQVCAKQFGLILTSKPQVKWAWRRSGCALPVWPVCNFPLI